MAKPRIFLSSTCYDLSTIRAELTRFLNSWGFEVLNSEDKNFGVSPGMHSHTACLAEIEQADYLLLLVGCRRGGTYVGSESSITNEEYKVAEKLDLPRIVAVQRKVWDHRATFKKNPRSDHSHIVDDIRIFSFIDYVGSGHSDNWIHSFETIEDIQKILITQLAHYLTLFSRGLRRKEAKVVGQERELVDFPTSLDGVDLQYPDQDEATSFRTGLRGLHDLLRKIITDDTKKDAKGEKLKQMWVLARYGDCDDGDSLSLLEDRFKQYTWSNFKGQRVNNQFEDYNIFAYYNDDPSDFRTVMRFKEANEENPIAWVLKEYVGHLLERHDADDAFSRFCRADMRIYNE
jgi:hypothetical protein